MPGFRARAFYHSGITTPEELLVTDINIIASILVSFYVLHLTLLFIPHVLVVNITIY